MTGNCCIYSNGGWEKAELRIEEIKLKGEVTIQDTVAYTVFGPVNMTNHFRVIVVYKMKRYYAVRWTAHDPSNDFLFYYQLNGAKVMMIMRQL